MLLSRGRILAGLLAAAVAGLAASCSGAQRADGDALAARCEVHHELHGMDDLTARVDRLPDAWLVSLQMRIRMAPDAPVIAVRGLGRVTVVRGERQCDVVEAGGDPGHPRFDSNLCLDELESLADLLDDAEDSARPGETVVQEVELRTRRRRRHARRRRPVPAALRERAEVTRDPLGRVVELSRTGSDGTRERVRVVYPASERGRCLVSD